MATVTQGRVRRGLPRVPGGEPWPPIPDMEPVELSSFEASVAERVQRDEAPEPTEVQQAPVAEPVEALAPTPTSQERATSLQPLQKKVERMQEYGALTATDASARGVAGAQRPLRRGLPRVPGGEPWPPAGAVSVPIAEPGEMSPVRPPVAERRFDSPTLAQRESSRDETPEVPETVEVGPSSRDFVPRSGTGIGRALRRGLPRVPGGEPWPPAGAVSVPIAELEEMSPVRPPVAERRFDSPTLAQRESSRDDPATSSGTVAATGGPSSRDFVSRSGTRPGRALRRGLPRVPGGEPWPPAALAPTLRQAAEPTDELQAEAPTPRRREEPVDLSAPLPFPRTVFPGLAAREWNEERRGEASVISRPEPKRYGSFTTLQWAGAAIVGGLGLLVAAAFAVLVVRWLVSLEFMRDFLATYPGEYPLPEGAPVGFPAWLAWQHFFNVFLIVLIIRTGVRVHNEKRPSAFWSPRTNKKRKISLTLWFHQSLDILWLVNGVAYVVLLLVTSQWMRIVPTSWEVVPNALSAGIQYVSLDWPTENGWVNYNSLQQLAYFATVFIAAPLAAITGVRMSGIWPKNADALNRMYPVEWARRLHYPVMVYFVAFIAVHVALVLATNALRNLNHMYGGQDAVNWTGFWIFVASMVVVAAGWVAARPLVLAPIARLFGTVSGR